MKSIITAGLLLGFAHGAAIAGPYVNVEANVDRKDSQVEIHKGYEGELGESGSWYVQGGPSIADTELEFSGKVGAAYDVSESVEVYGEYSFITGEKNLGSAVKTGVTYRF